MTLFEQLEAINHRPAPFEFYTARELWTDPHTSEQMLACHLNPDIDVSSRKAAFIDRSVEWIGDQFKLGTGKRIADFGCGPGLYANRLAASGAEVTAIDFSGRSLAYARSVAAGQGLPVDFVHQDYLEYDTADRFDLILMIMCDFCALSPEQRRILLGKFRSLLAPGGSVLLDVYSLNAYAQRKETTLYEENLLNGFWSPEKYYGFLSTFKYDEAQVILDKYTIVEADRIRTVYNWLQYFSPEALLAEFGTAGFTRCTLYGDVAGARFNDAATEFAIIGRLD